MFKAFYWMFETSDLRKQFYKNSLYLLILFSFIVLILFLFSGGFINIKSNIYAIGGLFVIFLVPLFGLVQLGYFWELTESIINRDCDVQAASVYGGKIKTVEKLSIPDFEILKFVWRGFSSILALLVMEFPVLFVGFLILKQGNMLLLPLAITLQIIILIFANGFAWNYAKRNSIFSTLNIRVGIHLLGTYPIRYIWNGLLIIVAWIVVDLVSTAVAQPILAFIPAFLGEHTEKAVLTIISLPFGIYFLHVNAYLIGTLTPPFKEECL